MVKEITQQEFDFLYVLSGKLRLTYINHDARRKSFFGKARTGGEGRIVGKCELAVRDLIKSIVFSLGIM